MYINAEQLGKKKLSASNLLELLEEVSCISFEAPSAFLGLFNKRMDVFHVALIGPPTFVPKGWRLVIHWPTAFQETISDLLEFCYGLFSRYVHVLTWRAGFE